MLAELKTQSERRPGRVLLVEDDVLLRELMSEVMRERGLTVIEAASADEAKRYIQAGGGAEVIFSDVEMPGSINGIRLGEWLRQNHPQIALVLTSGQGAFAAEGLGMFIPKPYLLDDVAELVRKLAEEQGDG